MTDGSNITRIAKNTAFLYLRMLLLLVVGLFTSRVVLKTLGVEDYGVYNVVGGIVTMFSVITASLSQAISRYLAFSLGKGDEQKLRRVFSTSVVVQLIIAGVIVILVETLGIWYLRRFAVLPAGRESAAMWVLQCSLGVMVLSLLSVPYNAAIIARERMGAYAYISILEALLKLSVALLLYLSSADKLKTYALLMLAVALIVRMVYGIYCRRHFAESRGRLLYDGSLVREMFGFAGWNFLGSSAYVFNTQGVNQVANLFFGVVVNAARGIASQIEAIVKQFTSSFLNALNPQITKSYASGDKQYCFALVTKGAKFSVLLVLIFLLPFLFEAEGLLQLWLGSLPEYSAAFVRLCLVGLLIDMLGNPLLTLMLATGNIKKFYLVTGLTSYLCLPAVWLAFRVGASPQWAYLIFIAVYAVVLGERMLLTQKQTGLRCKDFFKGALLPLLEVLGASCILPLILRLTMPEGLLRLLLVCLSAWISLAGATYFFALTLSEKEFVFRKVWKYLPDGIFLRMKYRFVFARKAHFRHPRRYTEVLGWEKLYDRKELYHTLVDKAAVKDFVAKKIGSEYVVPTLGLWDRAEDIPWETLPEKFVLKCTHDSGSAVICSDKAAFDRAGACAKLSECLAHDFYPRDREWVYKGLRPRIIAEQYLGDDPADYKFFCFGGKPEFMFVATSRGDAAVGTRFDFFDMSYRHLEVRNGHPNAETIPPKPENFEKMKELAARLSEGIPAVRVDFYDVGGQIYFGEYTFYHFGGYVPFEPDSFDEYFGSYFSLGDCREGRQ